MPAIMGIYRALADIALTRSRSRHSTRRDKLAQHTEKCDLAALAAGSQHPKYVDPSIQCHTTDSQAQGDNLLDIGSITPVAVGQARQSL